MMREFRAGARMKPPQAVSHLWLSSRDRLPFQLPFEATGRCSGWNQAVVLIILPFNVMAWGWEMGKWQDIVASAINAGPFGMRVPAVNLELSL